MDANEGGTGPVMDEDLFFLDLCWDSVWTKLPGGPVALDGASGEVWEHLCTVAEDGNIRHVFGHHAHPGYGGARVYAHVADDDAGPRLSRLVADGQELPLPPMEGPRSGDAEEDVEDLADP